MYLFEIVIFIMVTILLPIIPAYILYKALPTGKTIVTGHIELENNPSPAEIEHILVFIRPPLWKVNPDGKFSVDILVKPGATGEPDWPLLSFDHPSGEYEMIPIDTSTKEYPFGLPLYKKNYINS